MKEDAAFTRRSDSMDAGYLNLTPRFGNLPVPWDMIVPGLLLAVPAVLILVLFAHEAALVRRRYAFLLGTLRMLVLAAIWFVVVFQPALIHEHEETVPSRILLAVDRSDSMATRDPQRPREEARRLADLLGTPGLPLKDVDRWPRSEIVRRLLSPGSVDLLAGLEASHTVDRFGFRESIFREIHAGKEDGKAPTQAGEGTDLTQVLLRAGEKDQDRMRYLGLVVLSDGRHNVGTNPLEIARRLGRQGVPVFAVAIGSSVPPAQLLVNEMQAPHQVLRNADFRLRARVEVQGFPAQDMKVEWRRAGEKVPLAVQRLKHDGRTTRYDLDQPLKGDQVGTQVLEVRIVPETDPRPAELSEPATRKTILRVLQDKVRVLLVDGAARWEHHFLAGALRRDPDVALDTVLFDQPEIGGVEKKDRDQAGLPALRLPELTREKVGFDPLDEYDVIVLGDVGPNHIPEPDRVRLKRFVAERGGTLVLAAGKRHLPLDWDRPGIETKDSLNVLVPLRSPRKIDVKEGFGVLPTPAGITRDFLKLEEKAEKESKVWATLPKHFWAVVGEPAPGGIVLAKTSTPGRPETDGLPLLIEQGYGLGKVLWLGMDSTWRWRFRRGDELHHRFWGQVVRWAGIQDLLPAGNRMIRYGTRLPVHDPNQPVEVSVRILGQVPVPQNGKVRIQRIANGTEETVAETQLQAVAGNPRLFQGKVFGLPPGEYRLRPEFPGISVPPVEKGKGLPADGFLVSSPPPTAEMQNPSCDWDLLRALARESGGRFLPAEEAGILPDLLRARVVVQRHREEIRWWQDPPLVWYLFGTILCLLSLEWIGRKWVGLP